MIDPKEKARERRTAWNSVNLEGRIIENWTIVSYHHTDKHRKPHYLCRCQCGHEIIKCVRSILQGLSKSCGCVNAKNHTIHSLSKSRIYRIWTNMKNRCLNPNSDRYPYYGGRGVTICDSWMNSFESFFNDMGHPPTKYHSIDRIDNLGHYNKSNCKWSTKKEQAINRRSSVEKDGFPTIKSYCESKGINYRNYLSKRCRDKRNLPSPPNPKTT